MTIKSRSKCLLMAVQTSLKIFSKDDFYNCTEQISILVTCLSSLLNQRFQCLKCHSFSTRSSFLADLELFGLVPDTALAFKQVFHLTSRKSLPHSVFEDYRQDKRNAYHDVGECNLR